MASTKNANKASTDWNMDNLFVVAVLHAVGRGEAPQEVEDEALVHARMSGQLQRAQAVEEALPPLPARHVLPNLHSKA